MRRHTGIRAARLGRVALVLLLGGPGGAGAEPRFPAPVPAAPPAIRHFLAGHWARPIPPQGPAPVNRPPVERSLSPEACGTCHPAQYADWADSLHARAFGPGLAGQLVEMRAREPVLAGTCGQCHAPLAEQAPQAGEAFDPALQARGLVCAGCHLRQRRVFGPPRRDGSTRPAGDPATLPHGGASRHPAFLRAEFCAGCHQFPPGGLALRGKLLENTYEEWRRSPAARRGRQCQDCHMPDRRHRWKGIHDPEMVRSGVEVTLAVRQGSEGGADTVTVRARLVIRSHGVGHHFPTYVTPRVVVRVDLAGPDGAPLPGSVEERVIGREVTLDMARELGDTRIPAGGRFVLEYRRPRQSATHLRSRVTVYPDHFYTGFFSALLAQGAGGGEDRIREALDATRRSAFVLDERQVPLR